MKDYPGFIDMGRFPYGMSPRGAGWDYPDEEEEPEEEESDLENDEGDSRDEREA